MALKRFCSALEVFAEEFFPNDGKASGLNESSETKSIGLIEPLQREIADLEMDQKYAAVESFLKSHYVRRIFVILLKRHVNCPSLEKNGMLLSDLKDPSSASPYEHLVTLLFAFAVPHSSFAPHLCPFSIAMEDGGLNTNGSGGVGAGNTSSTNSMQSRISVDHEEHEIRSWRPREIVREIVVPAFRELLVSEGKCCIYFLTGAKVRQTYRNTNLLFRV